MKWIRIPIFPVAKPRMTQRDKWAKRPCVVKYYEFADDLKEHTGDFKLGKSFSILFCIPFPESYSKKKKKALFLKPHNQKPDLDNMIKSISDILMKEDKEIYKIKAKKIWSKKPEIVIINHN